MVAKRLCLLCLCLCMLSLSACGKSKPDTFYLLSAPESVQTRANLPRTTLVLDTINIAGYLDRPAIVIRAQDGAKISVPQFNVWAEPLSQGINRVLTSCLADPLYDIGITVLPSRNDRTTAFYLLSIDVLRLDATTDGLVSLKSTWTLIDNNANIVLGRGTFVQQEQIDISSDFGSESTFVAVVNAESKLLQRYGSELTQRLTELLKNSKRLPQR